MMRNYSGLIEVFPTLRGVVLDTTNARALAEFYRQLLGFEYGPGDAPPPSGEPDERGADWLVLSGPTGSTRLAFQQVPVLARATWPEDGVPQQLHLDLAVPSIEDLAAQHERALALGASLLEDRFEDPIEPLRVYADPDGHPFCIFVSAP
jgi:catechol 2,3-dioxygenase-like lactoylglutathione lyase family enzyme